MVPLNPCWPTVRFVWIPCVGYSTIILAQGQFTAYLFLCTTSHVKWSKAQHLSHARDFFTRNCQTGAHCSPQKVDETSPGSILLLGTIFEQPFIWSSPQGEFVFVERRDLPAQGRPPLIGWPALLMERRPLESRRACNWNSGHQWAQCGASIKSLTPLIAQVFQDKAVRSHVWSSGNPGSHGSVYYVGWALAYYVAGKKTNIHLTNDQLSTCSSER